MELDYSGRQGRDGQKKKIGKPNEKRKKVKIKEQKMMQQMEKEEKGGGRGCHGSMQGDHVSKIFSQP